MKHKSISRWISKARPAIPALLIFLMTAVMMGLAPVTCTPDTAGWNFEAVDTMKTPVDPPLTCDISLPASDPAAQSRSSCSFGPGDHASKTLGIPASLAAQFPVQHVIVLMKENRSFDHLFGRLHDQGQPGVEAVPASYFNPDLSGNPVVPFHAPTTCWPNDPGHQYQSVQDSLANGAMSGFVLNAAKTTKQPNGQATDGHFVMSEYEQTDLPFYYWLASNYAISDQHFASVASGTYSNRAFFMFGTNAGVVDTGAVYPSPKTPSIFKTLMDSGHTWAAYSDSEVFSGTLSWTSSDPGVHSMQDLYNALDNGTLPNVAFVDGDENTEDDHPTADLQIGEAWLRGIYQHALNSPQWGRLAIIWTYDEAGGFADHVTPTGGCPAVAGTPDYAGRGPRVPLVAISQWAKPHYVSHVAHDHTAVMRFIETIFDLPALTGKDANADALLDLFDFSCKQGAAAIAPAPAAGTGGCPQGVISDPDVAGAF